MQTHMQVSHSCILRGVQITSFGLLGTVDIIICLKRLSHTAKWAKMYFLLGANTYKMVFKLSQFKGTFAKH